MTHARSRAFGAVTTALAVSLLAGSLAPVAGLRAAPAPAAQPASPAAFDEGPSSSAFSVAAVSAPTLATAASGPGFSAGPTTHWVSPNAKFTVKAQLTNDGAPAAGSGTAVLQEKFGTNWVQVTKPAKLNAKGEVTISAISEDLQKETTYRVASGTTVSNEFTVELGAGKHTAFKLFKGNPRWQPCDGDKKKPIVYQLNLSKVPSNWTSAEADIKAAIANVSEETGLEFKQHTTGTTSVFPTKTSLAFDTGVDMVIAAGDATDSTLLPAKVGKILAVGGYTTPAANAFITKGYVMIDNRQKLDGGEPVAGTNTWQMVVRHELAHAIGLTHPSDSKQIMNPTYNNVLTDWGAGDRNGLQLIGVRKPSTMVYGQTADACHAATS